MIKERRMVEVVLNALSACFLAGLREGEGAGKEGRRERGMGEMVFDALPHYSRAAREGGRRRSASTREGIE